MPETFNLIDEPWIEVVDHDGKEYMISILDLLNRAENFRDFSHALGTVNFAILRVILAILYRSWDSKELRQLKYAIRHWQQKWNQNTLLDNEVQKYLKKMASSFRSPGQKCAVFQVPDLQSISGEWKKLDVLVADVGEEGELFSMKSDMLSITAAEAAQMVVHTMAYDYSGLKTGAVGDDKVSSGTGKPTGVGWAGRLGGTILKGDNLRETILLNYCPHREQAGMNDLPQWELPVLTAARRHEPRYNNEKEKRELNGATGIVELLTWPQRRLRLKWNGEKVGGALVTNGDPNGVIGKYGMETMTPWRYSEKHSKDFKQLVYIPYVLDPSRALWRSVSGVFPNITTSKIDTKYGENVDNVKPAAAMLWIGKLLSREIISKEKMIRIYMVSMVYRPKKDKTRFAEILEDSLVVRTELLDNNSNKIQALVKEAINQADQVAILIGNFYSTVLFSTSGNVDNLNNNEGKEMFYDRLDGCFRDWLRSLQNNVDPLEKLAEWSRKLKGVALDIALQIISEQSPAVWIGRWDKDQNKRVTGASATLTLNRRLNNLLDSTIKNSTYNQ